jgi:uncharacterized protein (TIRG00374 family)
MRRFLQTAFKTLLTLSAFWYLFASGRISAENITSLLSLDHVPFLIIAGAIFIASNALAAVRLVLLLRTIQLPISFSRSLKMTLVGVFFNSVVPGMTGGDIVKGYYLIKAEGEGKGRSSGIVILDRVMGLFAIMFLSGLSALYLLYNAGADLGRYQNTLRLIAASVLALCLVFLCFIILASSRGFRDRVKKIVRAIFKQGIIYRVVEGVGGSIKDRSALFRAFLISLVIQMFTLSGILVLARMVSERLPDIVPLLVVSSLVQFFGIVPVTPGNIGWTELLASLGWSLIGSNIGGAVFLYWRIIGIVFCSLPGGILYVSTSHKKCRVWDGQGDL